MRHRNRGRQLSRDTEHRTAMRRNLVQSLFDHGKVRTTLPKAKEVRSMAERLITLARTNTLAARRRVVALLGDRRLVDKNQEFTQQTLIQKLFSEVAPQFIDRSGGYTRIIKLAEHRIGDGGDIVLLQLVTEQSKPNAATRRRSAGLRRKRNERKHEFAGRVLRKGKSEGTEATEARAVSTDAAETTNAGEANSSAPQA